MSINKLSIVCILTSVGISSFGQNIPEEFLNNQCQIDSLSKISAYDGALLLALQNLKIVKNTSSPVLLGTAQSEVANCYFYKGNYDSTQHYAKKAIALGTENNLPEVTTSALLSIGNIHYSKFEDLSNHLVKILLPESKRLECVVYISPIFLGD